MSNDCLDNYGGACPMPDHDCPPGPCKCRQRCKDGEYSVSGWRRRMDDRTRQIVREEIERTLKP